MTSCWEFSVMNRVIIHMKSWIDKCLFSVYIFITYTGMYARPCMTRSRRLKIRLEASEYSKTQTFKLKVYLLALKLVYLKNINARLHNHNNANYNVVNLFKVHNRTSTVKKNLNNEFWIQQLSNVIWSALGVDNLRNCWM